MESCTPLSISTKPSRTFGPMNTGTGASVACSIKASATAGITTATSSNVKPLCPFCARSTERKRSERAALSGTEGCNLLT